MDELDQMQEAAVESEPEATFEAETTPVPEAMPEPATLPEAEAMPEPTTMPEPEAADDAVAESKTAAGEPDGAEPEPDRVALEGLATALFSLDDRLAESQRLLAHQSELVDKLHAENQRLRTGELRAALLPLVRDLLRLHDDIGRIAGDAERGEDLELIRVSLLDAFARNGIAPVHPAEGEPFDPRRHSAASVLETDDAARDRSVADVIRVGFEWEDGQTIRVADVSVYRRAARPEGSAAPDGGSAPDGSAT